MGPGAPAAVLYGQQMDSGTDVSQDIAGVSQCLQKMGKTYLQDILSDKLLVVVIASFSGVL